MLGYVVSAAGLTWSTAVTEESCATVGFGEKKLFGIGFGQVMADGLQGFTWYTFQVPRCELRMITGLWVVAPGQFPSAG